LKDEKRSEKDAVCVCVYIYIYNKTVEKRSETTYRLTGKEKKNTIDCRLHRKKREGTRFKIGSKEGEEKTSKKMGGAEEEKQANEMPRSNSITQAQFLLWKRQKVFSSSPFTFLGFLSISNQLSWNHN
jgi:hypothetical protein